MDRGQTWLLLVLLAALSPLAGCSGGSSEACEVDGDCPAGRYCVAGECVFDCATDAQCRDGFHCTVRGRCEPWCEDDADCDAGLHCEEGACQSECASDDDCQADEVCSERGRCQPACTQTNGGIEACDGLDNDCDGATDEDFADLGAACSNGACPEGQWICAADGLSVACDGPNPTADDADCNGLDDDCDGATDEDALPRDCPLQDGVCTGATEACLGAAGYGGCDYGPEYTEDLDSSCDRMDNDCDGDTDEDAAVVLVPEDGADAGDGLDNNCNGLIDEPGGVMVPAAVSPGVWIDAYESAIYENADCSGLVYGQAADDYPVGWPVQGDAQVELYACSLPGVVPSGHLSWYRADRACRAQGKRLCDRFEWQRACHAGATTVYPYGMVFAAGACNDPQGGSGAPAQAGQYGQCTSDGLTFDMSGNLAEWALDQDPDETPGWYSVGGYGHACTLCRQNDPDCRDCVPGDPDDDKDIRNLLKCDIKESNRNEFRRERVLPFFGVRCCLDGP